jgi:hypothetical protein
VFLAFAAVVVFLLVRPSGATEKRSFELPLSKASAVFNLLKPDDVKVIVYQDAGCVQISGTERECEVISDLVGLITRYGGMSPGDVKRRMDRARRGWTTKQTYRLPESKAAALFKVLAPDDVPVLVGRRGERVQVAATREDQRIIRGVVRILHGKRL